MSYERSPLEEAKERLPIPELWRRLGLAGEPRRHGRSPFREDRTPSFSIFAGGQRWWDFGTGSGGDAVDFLACASGLEVREAARKLIAMAGVRSPRRNVCVQRHDNRATKPVVRSRVVPSVESAERREKAQKRARWPALERCTAEDISAIARLRGLSGEGVALAADRGLLWMATWQEERAWVLTDSRRINAQARRLDGQPWERISAKAWTLPGSESSWPVGLTETAGYPAIALVEGGPDLLAACALAVRTGVADRVAPIAMLGAGQSIPREALPFLAGKGIRIFAQADDSGQQAARRWWGQVKDSALRVDRFLSDPGDLNDFVRREGEDHAAAMNFLADLPPPRDTPEMAEARRVAEELKKLVQIGALTGPEDPEAEFYAAVIRVFGARFGGVAPGYQGPIRRPAPESEPATQPSLFNNE